MGFFSASSCYSPDLGVEEGGGENKSVEDAEAEGFGESLFLFDFDAFGRK